MFLFYNMALELHILEFVHSILRIGNSFRQVIILHCKKSFLENLESCLVSPFGSLSAQLCSGLKFLSSCYTRAEVDNTIFLKYAKCQSKHNDFFILGSRRKEFKIKISHYWIAKAHIQNKLSEKQIDIQ